MERDLAARFDSSVRPFVQTYCVSCHGSVKPKGDVDLSAFTTFASVVKDDERWKLVLEKLEAGEMPPQKAKLHPTGKEAGEVVAWIKGLRRVEAEKNAGDPGVVLARRLSNSEYDYTIRDLTGVDMRPAREFPVDPSDAEGFDNSGESLVMSPSLLNKYLKAAREVSTHLFLKPHGFAFAPYPMLAETDRDKYCVGQIIEFYHGQNTNYADYFEAAWKFKHRAELGEPKATLTEVAREKNVSAKYLAILWQFLEGRKEEIGPGYKLQALWNQLPGPERGQSRSAREGCLEMQKYVVQLRKKVEMRFRNITAGDVGASRQPLLMWKNNQYARHRRTFDPAQLQVEGETPAPLDNSPEPGAKDEFGPGRTVMVTNAPGDPDLAAPRGERARYEAAFARFCSVFPDMFYKQERGRNYFDKSKDKGRYLSAGFHNVMGYFRDDWPLYELLLDDRQQAELDEMWEEMDFVALVNVRTFVQFYRMGGTHGEDPVARGTNAPASQDDDPAVTAEENIRKAEAVYLYRAQGGEARGVQAIKDYFDDANRSIRHLEKARVDGEPSQLRALLDFAERAWRRPLTQDDRDDLLAYYRDAREKAGLDRESAMRDTVVSVLMSPDFCYRVDLLSGASGIHPVNDCDLASRLSFFLWCSLPDAELMRHAALGDLHYPSVLTAQARRMLKDPRSRALAVEFGGNWLDFRRFEEINTVDHERFPSFGNELREAMFEEPVRFLMDVFQNDRPVLDCLYGRDTFVNPVLAKHYGMPVAQAGEDVWTHVTDADRYGRGGLLPMAAFLTKNAPGLRTSPVKRGNWVVKSVLGERIPPPPPVVPTLPKDESKTDLPLREVLARHRSDPNCAACHARFDSLGLVFEGYGPIGERREKDLAGRPVDASAVFPGGAGGDGLDGLRQYIRAHRENDFVNNLCGKLLSFALSRSLIPSDEITIEEMRRRLAANGYRFETLIDTIVTSPQFLNKRGRAEVARR
jgi:hypothetical protein